MTDVPQQPQPPEGQQPPGYPQQPGYQPQPGYPQQPPAAPPANNTTKTVLIILGIVMILFCGLPVMAILAVTLLGKNSSSKFSSVATAISEIQIVTHPMLVQLRSFGLPF